MKAKHTPGPWMVEAGTANGWDKSDICSVYSTENMPTENGLGATYVTIVGPPHGDDFRAEQTANARLIAAAPELLAYAECSAALECSQLDMRYDPQPVLHRHGWNGEENPGVFLSRIRRDALNKAVGNYLGRAAA